ncbi:hypothetical protein [Sporosarcina limicola]|uniref:YqgU-like 6-bladed beta-propeller domain-containing protein n=1 Tax=Sporosarcina limicola TaxID=34101 RepID=A0A927MH34_9BACL|nr:hypothetical protein [Sporosarcina limicola]MBE1553753.1 hypothetical protein [Sporosarcina limicola]
MRKIVFVFGLTALLVVGCTNKSDEVEKVPGYTNPVENNHETSKEIINLLSADSAKFHFVAGWLTDSAVVYVEKDAGLYNVNSFDLHSGETKTLFQEKSVIVDVLIHPSKKYILLHTGDNPASAIVKILTIDGMLQDEIEIASSELTIEWNDIDPSLILFTAFQQDWSFNLYLYEGKGSHLKSLTMKDPFPKWFGKELIVIGHVEGHILDGGELLTYNPITENFGKLDVKDVVYFDTYKESIVVVRINEKEDAAYTIMDLSGAIRYEWTMPAVSNYSEWVIPEIEWISNDVVFLPSPETGGQLDELTSPYRLIRIVEGRQEVVNEHLVAGDIRCSPSGKKCLAGGALETVINAETGESITWLSFLGK